MFGVALWTSQMEVLIQHVQKYLYEMGPSNWELLHSKLFAIVEACSGNCSVISLVSVLNHCGRVVINFRIGLA